MLSAHGDERFASADRISMTLHSLQNTHLDGLSHVGHLGKGFNGIPVGEMVDMEHASMKLAITDTPVIVTRGFLVDIPRLRGVDFMTPGDWVRPEELDGVASDIAPGDALLVRTGRWHAPVVGPNTPGSSGNIVGDWAALHVDCLDWVAEHDLAIVGTDSTGDTFPTRQRPTSRFTSCPSCTWACRCCTAWTLRRSPTPVLNRVAPISSCASHH